MPNQGSYDINPAGAPPPPKDTSFRSFVCALLVFLALCLALFLLLMFVGGSKDRQEEAPQQQPKKDVEEIEDNHSKSDKFVVVGFPDQSKEYESSESTTEYVSRTDGTHRPERQRTTHSGNEIVDITKWESAIYTERNFEKETTRSRAGDDGGTTTSFSDQSTSDIPTVTLGQRIAGASENKPLPPVTEISTEEGDSTTTNEPTLKEQPTIYENNVPPTIRQSTETSEEAGDQSTLDESTVTFSERTVTLENETPSLVTEINTDVRDSTITDDTTLKEQTTIDQSTETNEQESTTEEIFQPQFGTDYGLGLKHDLFGDGYLTSETTGSTEEDIATTDTAETVTSHRGRYRALFARRKSTTEDTGWPLSTSYTATDSTITEEDTSLRSTDNSLNSIEALTTSSTDFQGDTPSTEIPDSSTKWETTLDRETLESQSRSSLSSQMESTSESIMPETIYTDSMETSESTTETQYQKFRIPQWIRNTLTTETVDVANTTEEWQPTDATTVRQQFTSRMLNLNPATTVTPPPACNSTVCKQKTSKLLSLMNYDADPCEDFYDFACGGQQIDDGATDRENLKLLIDSLANINATSDKYLVDYKLFFESCVRHEQSFKYSSRLQFLYDFPNMNLTDLFAELILTQSMPLFDIGLDIDKNTQKYIFELTLPGQSYLNTDIKGWSLLDQIKRECMKKLKLSTVSGDVTLDDVRIALEGCQKNKFKYIAESFVDEMIREFPRGYHTVYNETTLKELFSLLNHMQDYLPAEYEIRKAQLFKEYDGYSQKASLNSTTGYDLVDWMAILKRLTFKGVSDETQDVKIYFRDYFTNLFQFLSNYTEGELSDILWLYSKLQLYTNTVVPKEKENRELYCMDLAKQLMPDTTSVISYSISKGRNQFMAVHEVRSLFEQLRSGLRESLLYSRMESTSRAILKDKLTNLELRMITSGDDKTASENNKIISLNEDDYQENVVDLLRNYRRIIYSLEGTNASAATLLRYFLDPFDTRPKSFYPSRYIVAHSAFLRSQPVELPKYLRLATMGMHLSRELAKHVDPIGKDFLSGGKKLSITTFYDDLKRQTKDLLYHYANYTYKIQGNTVYFNMEERESLWVNQMINDNTAFRMVYDLLSSLGMLDNLPWIFFDFPAQKVFFVAAAQEYCKSYTVLDFVEDAYVTGDLPPPLRIQNFLSNTKEFSSTFQCPAGSNMVIYDEQIAQLPHFDYDPSDYLNLNS